MIGIYKIENIINHKVYIGQSVDIKNRFHAHKTALRSGNHKSRHLQNAWNKYGEKNFKFEVVEECKLEELDAKEIYWIEFYGGFLSNQNYNQKSGGHERFKISEEEKERLRKANLGKKASEATKAKISAALKGHPYWAGKIWTDELKERVSRERKGKINAGSANYDRTNPEYRQNLSKSLKGKKKSVDHAKHISEGRTGISFSEEHRKHISESKIGNNNIPKGSKKMRKDGIIKWAKPDEIESFKAQGWEEYHEFYAGENYIRVPWNKGIPCSEEQKANLREKNLGKKLSDETKQKMAEARKGTVWVNDGVHNCRISKEKADELLTQGWTLGRTKNAPRNI